MTVQILRTARTRTERGLAALRTTYARIWRQTPRERTPAGPDAPVLPSWEDSELIELLEVMKQLTDEERREFLSSLYRFVLAYERSGDVRALTRFAQQARTTAQLWARPDFREAARRPANAVPSDATISVGEVLAKLGG